MHGSVFDFGTRKEEICVERDIAENYRERVDLRDRGEKSKETNLLHQLFTANMIRSSSSSAFRRFALRKHQYRLSLESTARDGERREDSSPNSIQVLCCAQAGVDRYFVGCP